LSVAEAIAFAEQSPDPPIEDLFDFMYATPVPNTPGREEAQAIARLRSPLFVTLDALALAFVLFHSITWFNLAPKAMVVRLKGKRVPDLLVAGANYAAWVVLSAAVAALLLRG